MEFETKEETDAVVALCTKIHAVLHDSGVTVDTALSAMIAVTAELCTECDFETAMCLMVVEDLIAEFRDQMEKRPTETLIPIPDQN